MNFFRASQKSRAFTLVELLVATVVLMIIMLMLVAMVNQTATIWRTSSTKIEQFRTARTAFESINRNLSQATLNSYYDYQRDKKTNAPLNYIRQSDLRFAVGEASEIVPQPTGDKPPKAGPTHAVFFHAPAGFVSGDKQTQDPDPAVSASGASVYQEDGGLLNTWGYFIEYGSDYNYRPAFLNKAAAGFVPPVERYRYRLMEFMVPSDQMQTYWKTSIANNNTAYTDLDWFDAYLKLPATPPPSTGASVSNEVRPAHMLSENIVALILLPQLTPVDQATLAAGGLDPNLAPGYSYNSGQQAVPSNPQIDPRNQLPPVVQVTMIAIDEASAVKMARANQSNPQNPPSDLISLDTTYFQTAPITPVASANPQTTVSASQYNSDLTNFQSKVLVPKHIAYRIFTTNVSLRAAKWSRD